MISRSRKTSKQAHSQHEPAANKGGADVDVLVLGDHPCAHLAAAMLAQDGSLAVMQMAVPGEVVPDRLVMINPALFNLHKLVAPLRRKVVFSSAYGLRFIADAANTDRGGDEPISADYRAASPATLVCEMRELRDACAAIAAETGGVRVCFPKEFEIHGVDEAGVDVSVDGVQHIRARLVIAAAELHLAAHRRVLGLPEAWPRAALRRYSFAFVDSNRLRADIAAAKPLIPMCLELGGGPMWAWLLPGEHRAMLAIERPITDEQTMPAKSLLRRWAALLADAGLLATGTTLNDVEELIVPAAGALVQEPLGKLTVLIGPAGGFFSACGEDVYPNCWSAVLAAKAIIKALKEHHVQDALHDFGRQWGAVLGEYLRGPEQNLRFLLPLVYRNPVMTTRLAESILTGRSVVR